MSTIPITRQSVEAAGDLDFTPREKSATIQIEVGPAGLTVKVAYAGSLDSIPAAIERLRQSGVLELVGGAAPKPTATNGAPPQATVRKSTKTVTVEYDDAGEALCPVHHRTLTAGQFGYYCSAKAREGDVSDKKGYCGLRFKE